MAYLSFERMKSLLEPLRLYDFEGGRIGSAELEAAACAIDDFESALEGLSRELSPSTAGEDGIAMYEDLLDLHPSGNLEARRRGVLAVLGARGTSIADVRRLLTACGIEVEVREALRDLTLEVSFPGVAGVPADFERIQAIIERMLPSHLEVEYIYKYITWRIFEQRFRTWNALEDSGCSWQELELIIE